MKSNKELDALRAHVTDSIERGHMCLCITPESELELLDYIDLQTATIERLRPCLGGHHLLRGLCQLHGWAHR
jgi:hypothetical protein